MLSTGHQLCAFLAGALASALAAALLAALNGPATMAGPVFLAAFLVATIHVLILAMPLYALVASRWPPTAWRVLPSAFLIGAGPIVLILTFTGGAWEGGGLVAAMTILIFGGIGLFGGLAFWLVISPDRQ